MVAELEGTDEGAGIAAVLVGEGAPVPDLLLQHEIAVAVGAACIDSSRIVGEVDCSVFDSLEVRGLVISIHEHPGFPSLAADQVGAA